MWVEMMVILPVAKDRQSYRWLVQWTDEVMRCVCTAGVQV